MAIENHKHPLILAFRLYIASGKKRGGVPIPLQVGVKQAVTCFSEGAGIGTKCAVSTTLYCKYVILFRKQMSSTRVLAAV
jgi:hypothetical protein